MPTAEVNGIKLCYEIHGEGEPLLLITGLGNSLSDYKRVIAPLAQTHRVIVFDNRGAGRSDKPDIPYSIPMMVDDTVELMNHLDVAAAHVLGVSMGGRIATELTLTHPDRVRRLILVSSSVKRMEEVRAGGFFALMLRFPILRPRGKYPQPRHAFLHQREASRAYDAGDRLREIRSPTLILHGKDDKVAPLALAEAMHAGIQGSQLLAFDGGHMFFIMRPQPFTRAVLDFIDGSVAEH